MPEGPIHLMVTRVLLLGRRGWENKGKGAQLESSTSAREGCMLTPGLSRSGHQTTQLQWPQTSPGPPFMHSWPVSSVPPHSSPLSKRHPTQVSPWTLSPDGKAWAKGT